MFFLVCEWLNYGCIKCICILENIMYQGRPHDLGGGGPRNFFFQIWKFACREATCCAWRSHAHSPCALLGGFGGLLPRETFFKTVQFGAF